MLEKSFGLLFFLKQPQNYESGLIYIYMHIKVHRSEREVSTKRLWESFRWNNTASKAISNKEDGKALHAYLETLWNKVYDEKRILLDANRQVSAATIKTTCPVKRKVKN